MFISSDEKCPVCNKAFEQEDDVVICPYCGTPHHRECYNSLGHCFNAHRHKEGFEYENSANEKPKETEDTQPKSEKYFYSPPEGRQNAQSSADSKSVCANCGAEIEKDAPFCSKCGARQSNAQYGEYSQANAFGINQQEQKQYESETQTIDGKRAADAAAVVRTNADKFIPKFIKNKRVSWNWSGFIFGPYYLMFRKMYLQGAIFMAINLIVQLVVSGLFYEQLAAYSSFMVDNAQSFANADFYLNPDPQIMNQLAQIIDSIMPAMLIVSGARLIIHIIIALFSDTFYRAKVISILDKVDSNLENGGFFDSSIPLMNGKTLSQSELRTLYLGRMGGTNFFAPVLAWFVLDLLTTIISRL